jgi:hypothetical protein
MAYKILSPDTSEAVQRLQFERLRCMGQAERFERGLQRVDESLALMRVALRRARPGLDEIELQIEWARVQFGEEFAVRLEKWISCRSQHLPSEFSEL